MGRIADIMEKNGMTFDYVIQNTGIKKAALKRYMSGEIGKMKTTEAVLLGKLFGEDPAYIVELINYRKIRYTLSTGEVFEYSSEERDYEKLFIEKMKEIGVFKTEYIE